MPMTKNEMKKFQIQDILTDIRCAVRDHLDTYLIRCELELLRLATADESTLHMDPYGWIDVHGLNRD